MFEQMSAMLTISLLRGYREGLLIAPLVSGAALLLALDAIKEEKTGRAMLGGVLCIPGAFVVAANLALPTLVSYLHGRVLEIPAWHLPAILAGFAVGSALGFAWLRYGRPQLDALGHKLTKTTVLERNRKTDVREMHKHLPQTRTLFDPRKYFDEKKGMFVGMDEANAPVYIPYPTWEVSHVLLTGRTRSGKGVVAQALIAQAIMRKEFVVVLDPKVDNWMPHTFAKAAADSGQPYVFLDLNPGAPPQFNIFEGCNAETLENMMIGAFSLAEKGDAADFYRLADRKAARNLAAWLHGEKQRTGRTPTPREAAAKFGADWEEACPAFGAYVAEMAENPCVNRASGGLDLLELERGGGCLYAVGDMTNTRIIRLQRMLLVRLLFLAKTRDYMNNTPRLMTIFADEFKVHISRPFIMSLGAALGWRLHCILAFQSLQDLADCPADLDKDSVKGSVMENCAVQLSYQIKDPDTREWLARSTGTILVDEESRRVDKNLALAETVGGERTIRQGERYLIDENIFGTLPVTDMSKKTCGCAVLAVAGRLAQYCYTSAVPTERCREAVVPTFAAPADEGAIAASASSLAAAQARLDDDLDGELAAAQARLDD